ncbi:glycosyltransferase [Bradyrhizobium sp. dw_411]|uniref:glycosyltransferase family 4 protein n=1 Tax=Bradyrhizobium sp. dw_411 TaxID=2720082 RepID=UPI001BCBFB9D
MIDRAPLRVAFTNIPRRLWVGGYNYQSNLFVALNRHCPGEILPVVFAGTNDDPEELAELGEIPGVEIVRSRAFDRRRTSLLAALTLGLDRPAVTEFQAKRIDLVFEAARFFGWRLPFPAVAWFPDFQHRGLPQLFSPAARWRRDIGFRAQIASGRSILLSSESALRDCREFYPNLRNEVSVVRFAAQPAAGLLTTDIDDVLAQYGLPSGYFYLPNQFWRHKNHQVVVDALDLARQRGLDVVVAVSGSPDDSRESGYFDDLMKQVKNRGLETNFRYLGMIPLDHVYALLRASIALINPSRFEGWSTTVEEAKSFGVPAILSDIDVHREQTGGTARYFGVDDPQALARHLGDVWQAAGSPAVRDLRPDLDARVASFAVDFARVIQNTMRSSRR